MLKKIILAVGKLLLIVGILVGCQSDIQLMNFANVIKNIENPLVSGREGFRTLQVIEAIQKSALTQQSVKVES